VVNTAEFTPGDFTRNPDFSLPVERLKRAIVGAAGKEQSHFVDAGRLATALLGQSIGANMFMLGYAYQLGALPVSGEAIEKAIEMNGEAVAMNLAAFRYGRRAAADPAAVEALVKPAPQAERDSLRLSETFDELVSRRVAFLTAYQGKRYARRYRQWVDRIAAAEANLAPGKSGLAETVARYLFKLMAYKDEYEVARLYSDTHFLDQVRASFDGKLSFEFHLAPPLLARTDKATGEPKKMSFGPWMLTAFGVLAKFRFLRGTPFDPFGYTAERRMERKLVRDYEGLLAETLDRLTGENHHLVVGLAAIPEKIRGYGPVKQRHLAAAKAEEAALRDQLQSAGGQILKAAE
jgi:indolepyruvate ferredoxin oxidoreductase